MGLDAMLKGLAHRNYLHLHALMLHMCANNTVTVSQQYQTSWRAGRVLGGINCLAQWHKSPTVSFSWTLVTSAVCPIVTWARCPVVTSQTGQGYCLSGSWLAVLHHMTPAGPDTMELPVCVCVCREWLVWHHIKELCLLSLRLASHGASVVMVWLYQRYSSPFAAASVLQELWWLFFSWGYSLP